MRFALLILLLTTALSAHSADVRPYDDDWHLNGVAGADIEVHAGDRVIFPNGQSFVARRELGRGSNLILDIGDGQVLRLPSMYSPVFHELVREYGKGYAALAQQGVPVAKIDASRSSPGNYIVSEKISFWFSLEDIAEQSPAVRRAAEEALIPFAVTTAAFCEIGDFADRQLVFDGVRWILLDWTGAHVMYSPHRPAVGPLKSIVDKLPDLPRELRQRLRAAIDQQRTKLDCAVTSSGGAPSSSP